MLDEFRSTSITWDKATRRIYSPITANASDSNGRKLNIQVVNSGQVENLTGATLHLYWETKDKAHDGLDAFTASDISKGEFELFYTTGMLSNVGELNATLVLVDSTGKVVSDWFKITVTRGINEGAIESENSFSSLTKALIDISNLEQNYAPRLNTLTAQLQQKANVLDVNRKILDVITGTPKIVVPSFSNLPAIGGEEKIALVLNDGHLYYDNGSQWVDFGVYQEKEVGINAVTYENISSTSKSTNVLDVSDLMQGKYYGGSYGNETNYGKKVVLLTSSNWYGTQTKIAVQAGDVVRFNRAFMNGYFIGVDDEDLVRLIPISVNPVGYKEMTVPDGITGFYTAVHKDVVGEAVITINNPMPPDGTPYYIQKKLDWLEIDEDNLSDSLKSKLDPSDQNPYFNSDGVICGDSIVDNVGENPTGNEVLIGYDGILITKLGLNSLENIGISGRPMADGTINGVGTVTTVTTATISWLSKSFLVCNAGTNDFKLNVPLGTISPVKSAFDTNTYIGAYQKMVEYVLTQNPDIEIVILTPAQRNNGGYSTETINSAGHKLIDYVNAAKSVAEKYSATLVDIYSDSGISDFKINAFTYDGLHFNNKGYEKAGRLTVKKMMYG